MFLQSRFFFPVLSSSKITVLCFFIDFQRIEVKSNRCFGGLSLISTVDITEIVEIVDIARIISKHFDIILIRINE